MVADTGIFIEHLRAKDKLSTTLYKIAESQDRYISAVTLYELYMGATTREKSREVEELTEGFSVLPLRTALPKKQQKYTTSCVSATR